MINKITFFVCLAFFSATFAKPVAKPVQQPPQYSAANPPEIGNERIVVHTNVGDIAFGLYPKVAPKHCEQILKLVAAGIYNGTGIFRIERDFVAQVENYDTHTPPLSSEQRALISKIPAEFNSIDHVRGILSMARYDADENSAESSFSFMLGAAPHLNGKYTAFGEVVKGQEVLSVLNDVPTDANHNPTTPIIIQNAEVVSAEALQNMKLAPAHEPAFPGEQMRIFFLIFAGVAFSMTVLTAILKTIFDQPGQASPSNLKKEGSAKDKKNSKTKSGS